MGAKLKSKTHLQNTFFDFLSRFLRVRLQSLQKVLIWPKKVFCKKIKKRYKKRRISRWFQFRWKSCKKMHKKKVISKKVWRTWVKSEKRAFSITFLLITFLWCIFSKRFQRIQNQREVLRILIPILNFFLLFLALFANFDCKCAGNGSKKQKIFFLWKWLRNLLGSHQRVCISKLLKSLYPNGGPTETNHLLKGLGHKRNSFLKACKIKSLLYVHAQMVFQFVVCLVQEKINLKFQLASLKTPTTSKNSDKSRIKFMLRLSSTLIGLFSPGYIQGQLLEQFWIFRITGCFWNNI